MALSVAAFACFQFISAYPAAVVEAFVTVGSGLLAIYLEVRFANAMAAVTLEGD